MINSFANKLLLQSIEQKSLTYPKVLTALEKTKLVFSAADSTRTCSLTSSTSKTSVPQTATSSVFSYPHMLVLTSDTSAFLGLCKQISKERSFFFLKKPPKIRQFVTWIIH